MNKIYELIAELSEGVFIRIGQRYSKDSTAIKDAVQECCLYLLQMNPETLKKIYDKDGEKGLIGYKCSKSAGISSTCFERASAYSLED